MTSSEHEAQVLGTERSGTASAYRTRPQPGSAHQAREPSGHISNITPDPSSDDALQAAPWGQSRKTKPPIFLALQGGGAKGIVHLGAVNAIYDLDFAVEGVAGTSAGSMVAALVAAGYKPHELLNLDGEGNLFESFPPELGMRKPTDLFPPNGWRALKALRGFGRFAQSILRFFSKDPSAKDPSGQDPFHRSGCERNRPSAQGAASTRSAAGTQTAAKTQASDEPQVNPSVRGRVFRFLNRTTRACRKFASRCRLKMRATWRVARPIFWATVVGVALLGGCWLVSPWLKARTDLTLSLTLWTPLLLLVVLAMIARQLIVGITNVSRVRDFIHRAMLAKVPAKDPSVGVTFQDLQKADRPPLKIVATNVYAQSLELFCLERTPDVVVADAVAASICLPVIFNPWRLKFDRHEAGQTTCVETQFLDGGLVSNLPAWPFDAERAADKTIATVALSIGEPPKPSPMPWPLSLIGTVVNGSKEVHTRAAGKISQIALKTDLNMLAFDAPVAYLREQATGARSLSQAQLIDDLYELPEVMTRFVGAVYEALLDLQVRTMMGWSLIDSPLSQMRVALALESPEDHNTFTISATAGYGEDEVDGRRLGSDHLAVTSWVAQEERCDDVSGVQPHALIRQGLWPEAKYVLCIPLYAGACVNDFPQAPNSGTPKSRDPRSGGCVLLIESNTPVDSSSDVTVKAFGAFVETAKAAVLKLEYEATSNKKIKLADFVQRYTQWQR